MMVPSHVRQVLEDGYDLYCRPAFIANDPICIPHGFSAPLDQEVSGLLAATLAWGQRPTILKNAQSLMQRMDNAPHQFVMQHIEADLSTFNGFVHRTFNANDCRQFVQSLRALYQTYPSLEDVFLEGWDGQTGHLQGAIHHFRAQFFTSSHQRRTEKHVADPMAGSTAKRLNMYLRWMVRIDSRGVDLGLWKRIPMCVLSCPLDVHSGRTARQLGLLTRTQNDHKAVLELDAALRQIDPIDPVRFDYALFGIGAIG